MTRFFLRGAICSSVLVALMLVPFETVANVEVEKCSYWKYWCVVEDFQTLVAAILASIGAITTAYVVFMSAKAPIIAEEKRQEVLKADKYRDELARTLERKRVGAAIIAAGIVDIDFQVGRMNTACMTNIGPTECNVPIYLLDIDLLSTQEPDVMQSVAEVLAWASGLKRDVGRIIEPKIPVNLPELTKRLFKIAAE